MIKRLFCKWFGHKWFHFEKMPTGDDYCQKCGNLLIAGEETSANLCEDCRDNEDL